MDPKGALAKIGNLLATSLPADTSPDQLAHAIHAFALRFKLYVDTHDTMPSMTQLHQMCRCSAGGTQPAPMVHDLTPSGVDPEPINFVEFVRDTLKGPRNYPFPVRK